MLIITLARCKELMSKEGFELFQSHQMELNGIEVTKVDDGEEFAFGRIEQLQYGLAKS